MSRDSGCALSAGGRLPLAGAAAVTQVAMAGVVLVVTGGATVDPVAGTVTFAGVVPMIEPPGAVGWTVASVVAGANTGGGTAAMAVMMGDVPGAGAATTMADAATGTGAVAGAVSAAARGWLVGWTATAAGAAVSVSARVGLAVRELSSLPPPPQAVAASPNMQTTRRLAMRRRVGQGVVVWGACKVDVIPCYRPHRLRA